MGEDKSGKSNESESRKVLGDVTNQTRKRGFSMISSSENKPKIKDKQIANDKDDNDINFWKQVALVVSKLEKENKNAVKCPKISNEVGLSPLKGGKIYRLQNASIDAKKGVLNAARETKEPGGSVLDSIVLDGPNVVSDPTKAGIVSGSNVSESSKRDGVKESQGDETVVISDVAENEGSVEILGTQVVSDDGRSKSFGADCVVMSKSESIVSSRLGESEEMQGFGLERCTLLKGDDESNVAADMEESVKHCSCSFCTKAAFIWSDLHYQDMKGRLSVLAKSQKEASNLAKKYYAENDMGRPVQGSNVNQLEIDLMSQWRSLFFHMEDMYGNEGSQLQNNFLALKDIRDEYKMNLETIGMPVDVLQCSSDASDHTS